MALMQSPADDALFDTFARLRDRGFMPPAPLALPEGSPDQVARALAHRTSDEVAALAASLVALPAPTSPSAKTVAEVLIAAKDPRAASLCAQIAAAEETGGNGAAWATLAMLRLGLEGGAPLDELVPLATAKLPPQAEAEALSRLLTAALTTSTAVGTRWLVPVDGGRFLAHLALSAARRPTLLIGPGEPGWPSELAGRLHALLPVLAAAGHPLAQAELMLVARRFDEADALHQALDHDDRARLLASRAELFDGADFDLPPLVATPLPDTDLESHLQALTPSSETLLAGALRERLGDRPGAARIWGQLALAHLLEGPRTAPDTEALEAATGAVRLADELSPKLRTALAAALAGAVLPDETVLASSLPLRKLAELSLRLSPDPLASARLWSASAGARPLPVPAASPAGRAPDHDPHHPASRLAAAADLLAEGRSEPAANVLAALLRKAEPGTPERLFAVVASALESDPPPDELVSAAIKALDDPPRAYRLIAALRRSATAAFALHEPLLGLAKDPSRPDPLRLAALESWLNIWAETTTPPNPDLLATLRELEPALLTAAATAIGSAQRASDPVVALRSFLDRPFASPAAWSDALLELMLGAR